MEPSSKVNYSGNSDVDVNVTVDTTALAYAYACFMNAKGQLDDEEFEDMLIKLDNVLGNDRGQKFLSKEAKLSYTGPRIKNVNRMYSPFFLD